MKNTMSQPKRMKGISLMIMFLVIGMNLVAATTACATSTVVGPPTPGNMREGQVLVDVGDKKPISDSHPDFTGLFRDVDIVSLITQIDEALLLGYYQGLTSFGPRVTGESGCIQAAEYLYNEFEGMGLDVRYDDWSAGGYESNNVEATLQGTDPTSDDIYIVCGHYDTVPGSPGADDDGSGVVAVLAAAQVMSQYQFNHTVRFVAFSGEEEGLYGSNMYVDEAYNNGDDIKGVLNADMIAFALDENQAGSMNIYEDDSSEWLFGYTSTINELYDDYIGVELVHSGWTWGSDHYYFWEYGYSALFYQEYEFSHYYHSPEDTIENLNVTYAVKGTRLILATLASLAQVSFLNSPPTTPTIQGPHYGKINVEYTFTIGPITDPEEDQIYVLWEWGDGSQSSWVGPFASGQVISATHSWSAPGAYGIRVKAKDTYGTQSIWSDVFVIYITSKGFLLGLVQDVNTTENATHLLMKRGLLFESQPLVITKLSSVQVVLLNDEAKGYIGSRFLIGQFYAAVLPV